MKETTNYFLLFLSKLYSETFLNYYLIISPPSFIQRDLKGFWCGVVIVGAGPGTPAATAWNVFPSKLPFRVLLKSSSRDGFSSTNCAPFEQSTKLFFYICSLHLPWQCPIHALIAICRCLFRPLRSSRNITKERGTRTNSTPKHVFERVYFRFFLH